jgi:hypothetical protein
MVDDLKFLTELKSELDLTSEIKNLKGGDNKIETGPNGDVSLIVNADEDGKPLSYRIVDKEGKEVPETFRIRIETLKPAEGGPIKVTCWECWLSDGEKHCVKVECPKDI